MLLELHAHSLRHSQCSHIDPIELVRRVMRKGLQGLVLTEHKYLWIDKEISDLRRKAEIGDNFLLLAGQEVETDIGHVLVFGGDRSIEEEIGLKELRRLFPSAAFIWAHPFRNGRIPSKEELLNPLLDAIEIFSFNHSAKENYLGLKFWHKYKFTAVSGSDTHSGDMAGMFPVQLDHPVANLEELIEEIKASRCRPFFKEIPKAGTNIIVTEITIGTKGEDESRNRMILKEIEDDKKWKKSLESVRVTSTLYEGGFGHGVYRVPKIIDIDKDAKVIIEEGQRGRSLFEILATDISPFTGKKYFMMAAEWLARLHNMRLRITDAEETMEKERRRFESYRNSFIKSNNPYFDKIERIIEAVKKEEEILYKEKRKNFIEIHGDFHPKNIIIGQDRQQDISTLFVSVIDFGSSMLLPATFDVGYFLSQFRSQFYRFPKALDIYREGDFVSQYLKGLEERPEDFERQLNLFKLRANLSIASYLIKVGKGEGSEMAAIIESSLSLQSNFFIDTRSK